MYSAPILPPSLTSADMPSGTVTFLFTDIEGSTALWEQQPEAMSAALARHDAVMRDAIASRNGIVFRTVGDAFCAAFSTAPNALAASVAIQISLAAESSLLPIPLRVRMGLHTGAVEVRDGDYYGQPLNRVSRLMTAGHGGQILLSVACQELTRDFLPYAVTLRDLGLHRLKDLSRPEQVFQILHPEMPADFPPLKSLNNPDLPNNLPQQMTSFIGRETEVAEIKALLAKHRMLTLTGAGGSGKTRLALQAAADMLDGVGNGVWLVELASLSDPNLVAQSVAEVLGVREEPDKPIAKTLVNSLKDKHLLLVLDNCEHVLAACAFLVSDLLRACPSAAILATSREALGVPGEQTYRVPSLSLPDPKQTYTAEALSQYEAVRLFIDRAGLSHPSFAVTSQNAPAVAQICARLDGIPLAIELAAARVKSLSAEQISTRLDDRFRLLTGGSRTGLLRQQTLKAAIDWSYGLLTSREKTLLCRLSVFAGGWTLDAAEAVCADAQSDPEIDPMDVLDLLAGLVDKSLAVYEEDEHGQDRYRLLETVRQYGRDRLEENSLGENSEADAVQARHQTFFLKFAEEAEPLLNGREQLIWLDRLETEHDNLRGALEWCLDKEESPAKTQAGLRLSSALGTFWIVRGHYSAGWRWLNTALERTGELDADEQQKLCKWRGKAYTLAAGLASEQGNIGEAQALFEQAATLAREGDEKTTLAYALRGVGWCRMSQNKDQDKTATQDLFEESLLLFRQVKDQHGITFSLRNLGDLAYVEGNYVSACNYYAESLTLARQRGDQHGVAGSLLSLGRVSFAQGDLSTAWNFHKEALPISRRLGDQGAVAGTLINLSRVAFTQEEMDPAQALLEEALLIARQLGLREDIASALAGLGRVSARRGDNRTAWARQTESLKLRRQLGEVPPLVPSLDNFAEMAHGQQQFHRAAQLLGAAQAIRQEYGTPLIPLEQAEQAGQVSAARDALGEEAFALAFAAGQAMTLDDALDYALTDADK
jgi:predicted ATPase/class 3 adenylate cyclase